MNPREINIKLSYIQGLRPVVLDELKKNNFKILQESDDSVYSVCSEDRIGEIKKLRSITRAYAVIQNTAYNPTYISKHKSVLASLVEQVITHDSFKTFKISCAGADSLEVRSIATYIKSTYTLDECEDADLKIHIIKPEDVWEIGIQITSRPLSVRDYKVAHMKGAMDPTIAYAVNSFCNLDSVHTYLNVFSGSGSLLIEARQCYANLEKMIGFDNDKSHLSLSIQNIKKAGLIQKVQVKEADIFDTPAFGTFDVIVSDVPFGMLISKGHDLQSLYTAFIDYSQTALNPGGRLIVYTSEYERMESILQNSQFNIIQSLQLKLMTGVGAYMRPKILVCEFKKNI